MRTKLINLYKSQLLKYQNDDVNSFCNFNEDRIKAMKNMIEFFEIISEKELMKFIGVFTKFSANERKYISSFELAYIQTRYLHLVKYNKIKNAKTNKCKNKSYLFGFIEETVKGYSIYKNDKENSSNSEYNVDRDSNDFLAKIIILLQSEPYKNIIIKHVEKMNIRSIKKFNNVDIQQIQPNKEYEPNCWVDDKKKESIKYIQDSTFLIQYPSSKSEGEGRLYNKYWNNLSKVDKINLFPDYNSIDMSTAIYQFLYIQAEKFNLESANIKYYIENKEKVRMFITKKTLNKLPYQIEKGIKPDISNTILNGLYIEIKEIIKTFKYTLFHEYEIWERQMNQSIIDINGLTKYISNHDELLIHKSEQIHYIPSMYDMETIEERLVFANRVNNLSKEDFIKERDIRNRQNQYECELIKARSIRKRCKRPEAIIKYDIKIAELKASYKGKNYMSIGTFI